jgi:hypothetical protein
MSALLPKADISKSALGCPMRGPKMGTKADIANLLEKWPFLISHEPPEPTVFRLIKKLRFVNQSVSRSTPTLFT